MAVTDGHDRLMDGVYRYQRHIYDLTRKYYLLGRDRMIADLNVPNHGSVLEIGCGTGRNLIRTMNQFPSASCYGIDISSEMLATAAKSIARSQKQRQISLACADASAFDPAALFGIARFDRVFISYSVSMIPQWQAVMREALTHLADSGELHIVDFGDQAGFPGWFRSGLRRWLQLFHVEPRDTLFTVAKGLAADGPYTCSEQRLYGGYAWISVIRRNG